MFESQRLAHYPVVTDITGLTQRKKERKEGRKKKRLPGSDLHKYIPHIRLGVTTYPYQVSYQCMMYIVRESLTPTVASHY